MCIRDSVNTVLMWAAYLGAYTALAAALTAAGQPMALVDVFDLLFGRNAADLSALLPGGVLGTAAPAARWLLLCWFALPLLIMWLVTLLPETVRGAVNQEMCIRDRKNTSFSPMPPPSSTRTRPAYTASTRKPTPGRTAPSSGFLSF